MVSEIVIIGGGPAGLSTARSYRESGGDAPVTIVTDEEHPPYRRPPLTKAFLRGELDAKELPIESPGWYAEHDIDLRLGQAVVAIDRLRGRVTLAAGHVLEAAAIVLATGSQPQRPDLPGANHPRVHTLRRLPESQAIAALAEAESALSVIGTGFIGCEIAASLAMRGVDVTLIGQEELPLLGRLGRAAGTRVARWLTDLDVGLMLETQPVAIEEGGVVLFKHGQRVDGRGTVLATGVAPRGQLAAADGLDMDDGAVIVDAHMRAAGAGNVLAVGDVAAAYNVAAGRRLRVEHWGDALEHGRIAGQTLAGGDEAWADVPGFWSTIGEHTLKYAAWGDGFGRDVVEEHPDGAFTVWYWREDELVGVLTHDRDEDYEQGRARIEHVAMQR